MNRDQNCFAGVILALFVVLVPTASSDEVDVQEFMLYPIGAESFAEALAFLRQGEAIAVPTETVYGLAGDATDPAAITRIYEAKSRPRFNPLIAHGVSQWAGAEPEEAGRKAGRKDKGGTIRPFRWSCRH